LNLIDRFKFSIVLSCQPTHFSAVAFNGDFENNLAKIFQLGYDGVELAIRDPLQMDFPALYSLLERFSMVVPAIGTGQAWGEEHLSFTDPDQSVREKAVGRILNHIPNAARLGSYIIIGLVRGKTQPGVTPKAVDRWLVDALQRCAVAAADKGVRLSVEPINRYETDLVNDVDSGLELLEKVGAANLGLLLDTFHMNIEEADILASIRRAGPHIFHFHVADSNRWNPGAGHLDFKEILGALAETGYTGFVSGEFMPLPDTITSTERAIAHLRRTVT
jgi:sugar phosphate isomerase/epimerase